MDIIVPMDIINIIKIINHMGYQVDMGIIMGIITGIIVIIIMGIALNLYFIKYYIQL